MVWHILVKKTLECQILVMPTLEDLSEHVPYTPNEFDHRSAAT